MSEEFKDLIAEMEKSLDQQLEDLDKAFMDNFNKKKLGFTLLDNRAKVPEYAYPTDSGFDLYCVDDCIVPSLDRAKIRTGVAFDIPYGFEIQVRPKSGLADKFGLTVLNTPGTVDWGYTDEIMVIVFNTSKEDYHFKSGDKIAQAVLCPVQRGDMVILIELNKIPSKDRGKNGFGSTGLK